MNEDIMLNRPELERYSSFSLYGKPYFVRVNEDFPSIMMKGLVGQVVVVGEASRFRDPYAGYPGVSSTIPSDVVLVPCNHNDKIFGVENLPKDYREGIAYINRKWLTKIK